MGFNGIDRLDDCIAYKLTDRDRAMFAKKLKEIDAEIASGQSSPRSDEYKEDLKHGASRTSEYGERVLEVSDAVIAESGDSAAGFAGWQVDAAGEV